MTVTNRIEYKTMYSDLVYPDWTNKEKFHVLGVLDEEYVREELNRHFGAKEIANKYAIQMPDGLLWYKHDFKTFILKPINYVDCN